MPNRFFVNNMRARTRSSVGLLQLRILRLGFLEDGDVGVGVFPEAEEVLVGSACAGRIAAQGNLSVRDPPCRKAGQIRARPKEKNLVTVRPRWSRAMWGKLRTMLFMTGWPRVCA